MSTFTIKPSPQVKDELFILELSSGWYVCRGVYETSGYVVLNFNRGFLTKESATDFANEYSRIWGSKFVGVKG